MPHEGGVERLYLHGISAQVDMWREALTVRHLTRVSHIGRPDAFRDPRGGPHQAVSRAATCAAARSVCREGPPARTRRSLSLRASVSQTATERRNGLEFRPTRMAINLSDTASYKIQIPFRQTGTRCSSGTSGQRPRPPGRRRGDGPAVRAAQKSPCAARGGSPVGRPVTLGTAENVSAAARNSGAMQC
jgi:hypothetical protein